MTAIEDARAAIHDAEVAQAHRVSASPKWLMSALRVLIAEHERLTANLEFVNAERLRLLPGPPTDDEREALAHLIADASAHPAFPRPSTAAPFNADYRAADAILASDAWRNRRQGPITDDDREPADFTSNVKGVLTRFHRDPRGRIHIRDEDGYGRPPLNEWQSEGLRQWLRRQGPITDAARAWAEFDALAGQIDNLERSGAAALPVFHQRTRRIRARAEAVRDAS